MSDLIRRYDIVMFENDWMRKESPTGDYVRYEDHAIKIERLRAALQSIVGQTDDCEADETYYGGIWREVNHTAQAALNGVEQ